MKIHKLNLEDITGWTNFPWGYETNAIQFLNSDTDHTVK